MIECRTGFFLVALAILGVSNMVGCVFTRASLLIWPDKQSAITLRVKLAKTPQERARGLMFEKKLDYPNGMLFMFENSDNHVFWMKNTFISLDIIFFSENWRVVGIIENVQAHSLKYLQIDKPSRYVLEVPAGFVKKYGIILDDKVLLRPHDTKH